MYAYNSRVERDGTDGELPSMNDWLTAWNRYMAIYCINYPNEQAKLTKHLEAVRDIADGIVTIRTPDP